MIFCGHVETTNVGDMPIADPETYEFLGRFDVVICDYCKEIVSKKPTTSNTT